MANTERTIGLRELGPFEFRGHWNTSNTSDDLWKLATKPERKNFRVEVGTWRLFWRWPLWIYRLQFTAVMVPDARVSNGDTTVNAQVEDIRDYVEVKAPRWMRAMHFLLARPCGFLAGLFRGREARG